MALGGVFITDVDGNIGKTKVDNTDYICGLVFDISAHKNLFTQGVGTKLSDKFKDTVVAFEGWEDVAESGLTQYVQGKEENDPEQGLLLGVPYYHLKKFYDSNGGKGLVYVTFADCSQDFDALENLQKAANGKISQVGVWTERELFSAGDEDGEYTLNLVADLDKAASILANEYHAPLTILLNANTATISGKDVELDKFPACFNDCRYVSVLLGQEASKEVHAIQAKLASHTPCGNVGLALGCLAHAEVSESIGWVNKFNLIKLIGSIEFGFGKVAPKGEAITNATPYEALKSKQLDKLDDKGYVFLMKYSGRNGVYFSGDSTCSEGDYRAITRNRTINKARRGVRAALLPYVNSPVIVDPAVGELSAAQKTVFTNAIKSVLDAMLEANLISGVGEIAIPSGQNILKSDRLNISFTITPIGTAKEIRVTEGLGLQNK